MSQQAKMDRSLFWRVAGPDEAAVVPPGPLRPVKPDLLFSPDTLRRAWLKVRAVGGGPGVDGMTIERFETNLEANLAALRADILHRRYRPQPVKRLLAPKPGGGLRPLALWALRDKVAQRVIYDCIEPYFERHFLGCSFGFRPGLGVADAVKLIVAHRAANRRWVADVDIKDCFDSLDRSLLLRLVAEQIKDKFILGLIDLWLNARIFNELSGLPARTGAAQGAILSPLLANIYLHQVDLQLTRQRHHLVRYADDMLVCCRYKQEAERALRDTAAALRQVKLELNPHKSRVVHFDQGFKFLGVFFLKNQYYFL